MSNELPIRQDITVLPADNPKQLKLGWIIYESRWTFVINDWINKGLPYLYNMETKMSLQIDEIEKLAEIFEIPVKVFRRMLDVINFDDAFMKRALERIRKNKKIQVAAYIAWETAGKPEGRDLEFWERGKHIVETSLAKEKFQQADKCT